MDASKPQPHGEVKVQDRNGYSVYVCADCGRNINSPGCSAKASTQPDPLTFASILNDPTQQLDQERVGLTALAPAAPPPPAGDDERGPA